MAWEDNELIFPAGDGRPVRRERALWILRSILKTSGLPGKIRTHDLRHTAASLMLALGTPLKDVQEMMGHSTGQITIDLYGHMLPGAQRAAAQRMDNALFERPLPQPLDVHSPRH